MTIFFLPTTGYFQINILILFIYFQGYFVWEFHQIQDLKSMPNTWFDMIFEKGISYKNQIQKTQDCFKSEIDYSKQFFLKYEVWLFS